MPLNLRQPLLFFMAILFCMAGTSFAQKTPVQAELIIVGTLHSGNKKFNHKTLYRVLKKIKPDIVLKESSDEYKHIFGLEFIRLLRLRKPGIEQLSLNKYMVKNKNCVIIPYDTIIPDRPAYIKAWAAIDDLFYKKLNEAAMSFNDSIVYASFNKKNKDYYGGFKNLTLARLNKADIVELSRQIHKTETDTILYFGKKYISDTTIVQNFEKELIFWDKRNAYMVQQIIKTVNQNPGKKIVVLCGLNHKYYLTDHLQQQQIILTDSYPILPGD